MGSNIPTLADLGSIRKLAEQFREQANKHHLSAISDLVSASRFLY